MNGKYLGVVIGAVVAIMLVGGVLMPIINDASTTIETVPAEGAYGFMSYQSEPEPVSGGLPYRYVYAIKDGSSDNMVISHGPANAMVTIESVPYTEFLNTDRIVYADSNIVIYVSNGSIYCDYNGQTTESDRLDMGFWVQNNGSASRCTVGTTSIFTSAPVPTYYYVDDPNGDYANFEGDNPPSMDTPSVSAAGMYIGPKETVTETQAPGYAIYVAIPLVILVALLTAVAFVAFKRDY